MTLCIFLAVIVPFTTVFVLIAFFNFKKKFSKKENLLKSRNLVLKNRMIALSKEISDLRKSNSEKLDSSLLPKFTSCVAHEVRNPLNALGALTEALFSEIENRSSYEEYYTHIKNQINRLSNHMQALQDFGRSYTTDKAVTIDLYSFCKSISKQYSDAHKLTNILVKLPEEFEQAPIYIKVDVVRFSQAFVNILNNANEHGGKDSQIEITIEDSQDLYCNIFISDQGQGIQDELLDKIFEPFFTTKNKCLGLGLTIAKKIIESHEGIISIYNNTPEKGVTVQLKMPKCLDVIEIEELCDETKYIMDKKY